MFKILDKKYFDVWIFYVFGGSEVLHLSKKSYDGVLCDIYRNGKILKEKFEGAIKKEDSTFFDFSTLKFLAKSTSKLNIDIFELDNGSLKEYPLYNQVRHLNEDGNGLFYQVSEDYKVTNGYTNISNPNLEYIFGSEAIIFYISDYPNAYYLSFAEDKQTMIRCFSISQKDITWHFSLPTLKDLYSPFSDWEVWYLVGVVEGVLWIDLTRTGKGALLGLDAQTGAVKHFLHQASPQAEGGFDYIPSQANTQYDPQTHKLIAFGNYHYWELDLKQSPYEVKIWNLEEKLRAVSTGFAVNRVNAMNDDYIFSFSGYLGNTTSQVFAFNRHTFEIDWRYEFDMEERGYYTPTKAEVTDTHLFVLDSTGTLHIFEKEE